MDIISFLDKFNTEEDCLKYLKEKKCKKQFSCKVGTIFQDSKVPLKKWFLAIYFVTNNSKGISSIELSKKRTDY